MTLTASDAIFPENIVSVVAARIPGKIDSDLFVARRLLSPSDPPQSVAVVAWTFAPDATSYEFRMKGPTLNRHNIVIQSMIKSYSREEGTNIHSVLSSKLRHMIFYDAPLDIGLTALSVTVDNVTERLKRRGITQQRYLSNEVEGQFVFTSWLEVWMETETLQVS